MATEQAQAWNNDFHRKPVRPPYQKKPSLTAKVRAEIRERYQAGETAFELAKEFGCSAATIYQYGGKRS